MAYRSLPAFNAEARFAANRAFTYNGRAIAVGEPVEGIPTRRLRQLFEVRRVSQMAPAAERKQTAGAHSAPRKGKK